MLQRCLSRPIFNIEPQETEHLLTKPSYLPLTVVRAAAGMNASCMTVQEYRSQLDKHSGDLSEGELRGSGVKDPIATMLFLFIDQISCNNAFATDYLLLTAYVDQKDILLNS
jgi:hypothetical protein